MTEIENQKQGERVSAWFMKFSLRSMMRAFLDSRKRQTVRAPQRSPTPPGQMLEKFILPRLKLTPEDVVNRTDISSAQLHLIFSGEIAISAEIAERLRPALGDYVSNLVTNHQSASDYYKKHGNWPPSPGK